MKFVRNRLIVWNVAIPILIVASILSPLGAWVSQGLDRNILLWLFVGFLIFAAVMMLFYKPREKETSASLRSLIGVGMGVGGLAGFLGGLLGVGGGNIVVPALVALGFDPKKASATTSFVVIFSSLTGFLGHVSMGGMDSGLLAWTVVGSAGGAAIGSWLMVAKLKGPQVKLIIGVVLMLIAANYSRPSMKYSSRALSVTLIIFLYRGSFSQSSPDDLGRIFAVTVLVRFSHIDGFLNTTREALHKRGGTV